jgi:hypothetical protein
MSLPIRQGRLFPDSPEPSKKFGDSLATIKYRCDLKPVYVSHMYGQKSRELWDQGKTQSLGVKARFGHFRADIHQRKEEKQQSNKKLKRDKVVSHKAFYAADLILEDIEVKGIRAEFHELPSHLARRSSDDSNIPSDHDADRESPIEYTMIQRSNWSTSQIVQKSFTLCAKRSALHLCKKAKRANWECPNLVMRKRTFVILAKARV